MKILVVLLVGISSQVIAQTKDYCAKSLCQNQKHVACGNKGAFGPTCPSDKKLIDLKNFKGIVTDAHNKYRNQIASGKLAGYKPAVRMATMVWDDELAKIATLNVKTCKFEHDLCHNTDRFKSSGQNLATMSITKGHTIKTKMVLQNSVKMWFDEYKLANMNYVNKFVVDSKFAKIGHFTEMILDKNIKVGCGAVTFTSGKWTRYNVACNYASIHMANNPLYTSGPAASKCTKGKNPKFPGLCKIVEVFNPNWW